MIMVNTHAAKTRLSQLLAAVEKKGEVVVICRAGKPVAELRAAAAPKRDPLKPHPVLSKGRILVDPTLPLDPAAWPDPGDLPDPG